MNDRRMFMRATAAVLIFCAIVFGTFLAVVHAFPERFENFDTLVTMWVKRTEAGPHRAPSILVMGDSTAACGFYAPEFERALSVAALNSTPVETYYDLKRRLEMRAPPVCGVLALSWDWNHYKHFFWRTFSRAGYYSPQELDEIYRIAEEAHAFPATSYSRWNYYLNSRLYSWRVKGLSLSDFQDALFDPPEPSKSQKIMALGRNRGSVQLPAKLNVPPPEGELPEGETAILFKVYTEKLFQLAQQNSVRLIYVEIPKTESEAAMTPDWFEEFAGHYGVAILKPDLKWSEADFSYPHHLRAEAAIRLTEYVRGKIQNECYR